MKNIKFQNCKLYTQEAFYVLVEKVHMKNCLKIDWLVKNEGVQKLDFSVEKDSQGFCRRAQETVIG